MHPLALLFLAAVLTASVTGQAETLYVTLEKDHALAVVTAPEGRLIKTVKIGKRPRGIALSQDGKFLYVAVSDEDTIKIVDTATLKVAGKLPPGRIQRHARPATGCFLGESGGRARGHRPGTD